MMEKKTIKRYIYERDGRCCTYCGKELLFKQISLDHHFPRSRGGSDDVFNMVLSCRKCNKLKSSRIPQIYEENMIRLFQKALEDRRINISKVKFSHDELLKIAADIDRVEDFGGDCTVFQSPFYRILVYRGSIEKMTILSGYRNLLSDIDNA